MTREGASATPKEKVREAETAAGLPRQERRRWPRDEAADAAVVSGASPVLSPLKFSTQGLPKPEQFDAWKALMEPLVDVRLPDEVSLKDGFSADHTAWNLGSVLLVQQRVDAHSYARSAAKLRASPIDHWCVGILRSGRTWTEVDGQVARNDPGKAEFRTLGHTFRGRTINAESVILYIPRDLFGDASGSLDAANNSVFSGNLAHLLLEYVASLEDSLKGLVAEDLPGVIRTLRDMVTLCLSSADRKGSEQHGIGLMERARRYIHQHIASPDLTPESLSHELGVSRTRLYQLFEPSGGVSHYIRKRRLLAAHAALSNPANQQRILEIAEAAGFDTPANFSRAFRLEFGYSPREARDLAGTEHSSQFSTHREETTESFRGWLAALGA